jgi:2-succinyl-5-enolpyruvyl-6-hydroxy-3-cyclohexene-1-carboxylate synthase
MAVADNPHAQYFIHFDERGSAYHALGYARATGEIAAVITTSGTAVANLLPAVCEAHRDDVPLILLTADRPPELIDTEANQTLDQRGIFGSQVRLTLDLPCPTNEIADDFLTSTIDWIVTTAVQDQGPVHLNCRYRKPLFPPPDLGDAGSTSRTDCREENRVTVRMQRAQIDSAVVSKIGRRLREAPSGLLVIGRLARPDQQDAVMRLAEELHWPVLADITSGLRLGNPVTTARPYYDLLLAADENVLGTDPGLVLHLGGRIVSSRLQKALSNPSVKPRIRVDEQDRRGDQDHDTCERYTGDITRFCHDLAELVAAQQKSPSPNSAADETKALSTIIDAGQGDDDAPTGLSLARLVTRHIDQHAGLYLGNSLAVRDVNSVAATDGPPVRVACNRGVSGIDGTVASAAGFCRGLGQPVTVLLGDLALLHDLNSLAMLTRLPHPVTVIVSNNDGGGIFGQLPIREHHAVFEEFFTTPHGFDFRAAAEQFNLEYWRPTTNSEFVDAYHQAQQGPSSSLIEVTTDNDDQRQHHRDLVKAIAQALPDWRE